jgi:hypothetical protein
VYGQPVNVLVDLDGSLGTTVVLVELCDDGSFRVRCSPAVDVETLLALNGDVAQQIIDAVTSQSM